MVILALLRKKASEIPVSPLTLGSRLHILSFSDGFLSEALQLLFENNHSEVHTSDEFCEVVAQSDCTSTSWKTTFNQTTQRGFIGRNLYRLFSHGPEVRTASSTPPGQALPLSSLPNWNHSFAQAAEVCLEGDFGKTSYHQISKDTQGKSHGLSSVKLRPQIPLLFPDSLILLNFEARGHVLTDALLLFLFP